MRYIDADVAMDAANRLSLGETDAVRLSMRIVDYLNRIPPTADVAPVRHAEWIEKEVIDGKIIEQWQSAKCSKCGKYHTTPYMYFFDNYAFCPGCGAKMDGGTGKGEAQK